ncbi:MAG: sulfite exporter TauE/SafE family protein [Candidatus Limnocylindria bacterium]
MIDSPLAAALVIAAGMAAGTINTIVGSGSLISFPTLLLLGYPPLVANVSNTLGLIPGVVSGMVGYRRELAGQRARAIPLLIAGGLGGLTGGLLLLVLPEAAFNRIVPILILVACALMAIQPRLTTWIAERRIRTGATHRHEGGPVLLATVYATGIYGGYFGAGQGVILIAMLAILITDDLQRLNGLKNAIAFIVNAVAAVLFIAFAPVAWEAALLLGVGAIAGGQIGAHIGRRMSPFVLRGTVITVGLIVAFRLLLA